MAEPITCPLCAAPTHQREIDRPDCCKLVDDYECTNLACLLQGPAATLDLVRARTLSAAAADKTWRWQRFNLNESVRVTLNDKGLRVLAEWHAQNVAAMAEHSPTHALVMRAPRPESDRVYRFQAWEFMQIFGSAMGIGREPFADMNIEMWVLPTEDAGGDNG